MFRLVLLALFLASAAPAAAQYRDRAVQMGVVSNLDLNRYAGRWYEIARFPNRFERGCVGVTADYALLPDGRVSVVNTCVEGALGGPVKRIEGRATVAGPGRLRVNFVSWLPFAAGDYWVLDVTSDYGVAVVGEPSGSTGWILARRPRIAEAQKARALAVLARNGYDTGRLDWVLQGE